MSNNVKLLGFLIFIAIVVFMGYTVYSGTVIIPQTGQVTCYDSAGNTVSCSGTGQDGDTTKPGGIIGEVWTSPRFSTATSDTGCSTTADCVKDQLTGLVWVRNGSTPAITDGGSNCNTAGKRNWTNALLYVSCMNAANAYGNGDWRLPNVNELRSIMPSEQGNGATWLMDSAQGWSTIGNSSGTSLWYWASSTYVEYHFKAWAVNFREQQVAEGLKGATERMKSTQTLYVLPVRGGTL